MASGSKRTLTSQPVSLLLMQLALGLVVLVVLWQLVHVFLLVFAAILVAIGFKSLADLVERLTPLGPRGALAIAIILLAVFAGGVLLLLGAQLAGQFHDLVTQIPGLLRMAGERLGIDGFEQSVAERLEEFLVSGDTVLGIAGTTLSVLVIAATSLLVLIAGIFIAARPRTYRRGFLILWPAGLRSHVATALDRSGIALRYWLLGQMVSMTFVGVLSAIGLMLLGVPSAVALGLIAAATNFVPIVGPFVGGVPAVLIAFSISPPTALMVVGLYVLIQQIDGDVLQPFVQQQAVDLPPALTLFALVAGGVLFGALGIILATPLAVVALVSIKILYVRDTLGEAVDVPGDP